jgi:hypothetical protein
VVLWLACLPTVREVVGSSPGRVKPKQNKIGIRCFSAKRAALMSKSKDLLAQSHNTIMCPSKVVCLPLNRNFMGNHSLVKIHWKMLILECSQGCYAVKIWPLDLWPWKSIGFQTLLRTKYVPSLVKIHWMLILVFTRMSHGKNLTRWPWPLTYDLENQ